MRFPSDAEVIARSLGEPEAFELIYDRHAATAAPLLGQRAGTEVAEGLLGELCRIAAGPRDHVWASAATRRSTPKATARASSSGCARCRND